MSDLNDPDDEAPQLPPSRAWASVPRVRFYDEGEQPPAPQEYRNLRRIKMVFRRDGAEPETG